MHIVSEKKECVLSGTTRTVRLRRLSEMSAARFRLNDILELCLRTNVHDKE